MIYYTFGGTVSRCYWQLLDGTFTVYATVFRQKSKSTPLPHEQIREIKR